LGLGVQVDLAVGAAAEHAGAVDAGRQDQHAGGGNVCLRAVPSYNDREQQQADDCGEGEHRPAPPQHRAIVADLQ
jgi:hypothetical protein